ncbi:MAG: acyl-CoA thioesterase [Solirubrobacterales bacterium]
MSERRPDRAFVHRLRVRYHEIDGQSHVYNARYLEYLDVAMVEFFRELGWGLDAALKAGFDPVLARVEMDFRMPARVDEILGVEVRPTRVGGASFDISFAVRADHGDTVLEAAIAYVNFDTKARSARPVPAGIAAALRQACG